VDGAEEISSGFVIACGGGAELFEFAEEISIKWRALQAIVGIVGLVGDQQVGGHVRQQGISFGEIVNLSWGHQKAQRAAEGVDQAWILVIKSLAAAHRLIITFFGCPGAVLIGTHDGAVDHRVFVVGITGEVLKQALPYLLLGPAAEPPLRVVEPLGRVVPWNSGAVSVEYAFPPIARRSKEAGSVRHCRRSVCLAWIKGNDNIDHPKQ
jgi:hypothetical protein